MKPIETIHSGYRFRSRLEARWAVFFETLGIKYRYEDDGFPLKDGTWYLPDFWLPELRKFVEIKPENPSLDEAKKCCGLAKATGNECMLIFGQPWMHERKAARDCGCCELGYEWEYRFHLFEGHEFDPSSSSVPWEPDEPEEITIPGLEDLDKHVFAECRRCPMIGALILNEETCPLVQGHWSFCSCTDKHPYADTQRLMDAYTAARQARFSGRE
jgi:hypothetical protein